MSEMGREERVYLNGANVPLMNLIDGAPERVLDVGCGAGSNAALLRSIFPKAHVDGITISASEKGVASQWLDQCWVFDLEEPLPEDLSSVRYDALIFSHVLEHLRDPDEVLARFVDLLAVGGAIYIAVPNVLNWRQRIQFLMGRFEYESAGVLDNTHLRFFTYFTADSFLLKHCPQLSIRHKSVSGGVPLWWLRRYLLPKQIISAIDAWGCRHWPNLFGGQILIKLVK